MSSTADLPDWFEGDPFFKLRPLSPTPFEEICRCAPLSAILLRDGFGRNPLQCVDCQGEVAPERVGFDCRLAEDLAEWRGVFHSLYSLWLDSGEYEQWALQRLEDPAGQVNAQGLACVSLLNHYCRAYYWWFVDNTVDDFAEPTHCPVCRKALAIDAETNYRSCEPCSILM